MAPASTHAGLEPIVVEPPGAEGDPRQVKLRWLDGERAVLERSDAEGPADHVLLLPPGAVHATGGVVRREVIVAGWRVEVDLELASRAALRTRARRGRAAIGHSGPTEVRAMIPGVVVSVAVADGDAVTTGQRLVVVEAMKMQNELLAPRDGTVERIAVVPGNKVEVGDLLLAIT